MPLVDEINLGRQIRNNDIANLYLFYGKDVASIENFTKKLLKKLVPAGSDDMIHKVFDGRVFDLSYFADVCESYPMFSERNIISVNDFNADSLNAADYKFLTQILQNLPESTVVIFYVTSVDLYKSKTKLTEKNQKFVDFCTKHGTVCNFSLKSVNEMGKIIAQKVTKKGSVISKKNAEYLAEKLNGDTVLMNSEIEKLTSFVNDGEITSDIIDSLCVRKLDADVFKLASAIAQKNSRKTFAILDELYSLQAESIQIISAMSMSFVDIYKAFVGKARGKNPSQICEDFKYPKYRSFAVTNAYKESSEFIPRRIRRCMRILSQADIAMKSQRTDRRLILEKAIIQMLQ